MKTKLLILLFSMFSLLCFVKAQSFSGGDGSKADPFQITIKDQLLTVKNFATYNYKLMNDIDFEGSNITSSIISTMTGNFNGNGHKVSNIVMTGNVYFFGEIASTSTIVNLHLRNSTYTHDGNGKKGATTAQQNQYHAPMASTNRGTLENCSYRSTGSSVSGYCYIAGFILNNYGTIKNCYANTDVVTIASYNNSGNWYEGRYATGFVIFNYPGGLIENCYYKGEVTNGNGGSGGFAYSNEGGMIRNCFSLSTAVATPSGAHRLVGGNSGTLTNNYARTEMTLNGTAITSNDASSIEAKDVAGSVLNQAATYTDQGWNFTQNWAIPAGEDLPVHLIINPLSVSFASLTAKSENGQFVVEWTVSSETNNEYFIIEASSNGADFKAISEKIFTKAKDGTTSTPLQYGFSIPTVALGGMAMLALLLSVGFSVRRRVFAAVLFALSLSLFAVSCQKNFQEASTAKTEQQWFIRIKQVDKNGEVHYSKVVSVTLR